MHKIYRNLEYRFLRGLRRLVVNNRRCFGSHVATPLKVFGCGFEVIRGQFRPMYSYVTKRLVFLCTGSAVLGRTGFER